MVFNTSITCNLPSPLEMAAFDQKTIASGVKSHELMERAGREIYRVLRESLPELSDRNRRVTILLGPGNNGGDGAVIGRLMRRDRIFPEIILIGSKRYSAELVNQLETLCGEHNSLKVYPSSDVGINGIRLTPVSRDSLDKTLLSSDVILDAMLGTGQRSEPSGPIAEALQALAHACAAPGKKIVAVDIPTGVNADTGEVYTPAVKADLTITVEAVKRGMLQYPARDNCGEIKVVAIGIDTSSGTEFSFLTAATIPKLPPRRVNSHKGNAGRVLVVGGCQEMPGAPRLSSLSALRAGAGLVTQAVIPGVTEAAPPELLFCCVEAKNGFIDPDGLSKLEQHMERSNCLILGPGIGLSDSSESVVTSLLKSAREKNIQVVLDADGLTIGARHMELLKNTILTPHPGEASRLLGVSVSEVQRDRYSAARNLAQKTQATVVLKGAGTVVYSGNEGFVNSSGNSWMATAGSGDVLAGIIGGLIAQGPDALCAVRLGVYLHGLAGELASNASGGPIIASDIISQIPRAFGQIHAR